MLARLTQPSDDLALLAHPILEHRALCVARAAARVALGYELRDALVRALDFDAHRDEVAVERLLDCVVLALQRGDLVFAGRHRVCVRAAHVGADRRESLLERFVLAAQRCVLLRERGALRLTQFRCVRGSAQRPALRGVARARAGADQIATRGARRCGGGEAQLARLFRLRCAAKCGRTRRRGAALRFVPR